MKPPAPALLPVFRSRLVGELLALVLLEPRRRWTADELSARTGSPYSTVTRELRRLGRGGVVEAETLGRTRLWSADTSNPLLRPLSELVIASFGPPQVIGEEIGVVAGVDELYLFGSWAAREAGQAGPPPGDIDVLVLGEPSRENVYEAARRAEERLGRPVNTTVRSARNWESADDGFARSVKAGPLLRVGVATDS